LINLFRDFDDNVADLYRLNSSLVTLIPKENNAKTLKKFRPIALTNCCFKIFSKACTNRMGRCANRLISSHQTAFIRGRYILESMVTAQEIIHDVHHNKEEGIILKLDYEKAYDRVDLSFLEEMLKQRGFSSKWVEKFCTLVHGGSVGIRINDENSNFFQTGKGLRQGDPLSPISSINDARVPG
jgi:hypothetical protein